MIIDEVSLFTCRNVAGRVNVFKKNPNRMEIHFTGNTTYGNQLTTRIQNLSYIKDTRRGYTRGHVLDSPNLSYDVVARHTAFPKTFTDDHFGYFLDDGLFRRCRIYYFAAPA